MKNLNQYNNLSHSIGPWLRQAISLAESASDEILAELRRVESNLKFPSFRLAFVGEFSRGKSSLVNNLLGSDVLPTGSLPTTAVLTSVLAGPTEKMEVLFHDGRKEVREIDDLSWEDLIATSELGEDQEPCVDVRLTVKNPWLEEIDVELLDTPGAKDLSGKRAALISQVLDQCDAAVLVTSATLPFSETEIAFLQQEVIGRHIPNIIVVVSKLDLLSQEERSKSFKTICNRVGQVSNDILVLPLNAIHPDISDSHCLDSIRSKIETMIAREGRLLWRSQRIAGQIVDNLEQLIEIAKTAIGVLNMSAKQQAQAFEEMKAEHRRAGLEWEKIRLELDRRRLKCDESLRQEIFLKKNENLDGMLRELEATPSPKIWWSSLPNRMRSVLLNISRQVEIEAKKQLSQDSKWFADEVTNTFSIKTGHSVINSFSSSKINAQLQQLELMDQKKQRFLARVGTGASMASPLIVQSLIGGGTAMAPTPLLPIALAGIALGVGANMLLDKHIEDKIDQERGFLAKELESAFQQVIYEFTESTSEQLRNLYDQLINNSQVLQTTWQTAREAPFKSNRFKDNQKLCQDLIQKSLSLQEEIIEVLESGFV